MMAGWGRRNAQSYEAGFPAYLQINFETAPVGTNTKPDIRIESPWDQMNRASYDPISISVSTTDSTGYVESVSFYVDGNLIGTDTDYPFQTSWTPVADGSFAISAVALALIQFTLREFASISSLKRLVPMNHAGRANWMSGSSFERGQNG